MAEAGYFEAYAGTRDELGPGVTDDDYIPGRGNLAADAAFQTRVPLERSGVGGAILEDFPGFFSETIPRETTEFLGETFDYFAPEESRQATPGASIAQREAREVGRAGALELGSVIPRIPTQVAEAFAYTPAFAYYAATDPVGTARGLGEYVGRAVDDPLRFAVERPGDLAALLIGAKGLGSGRAANVAGALRGGEGARGAVRAAVRPARSTGALQRGVPLPDLRTSGMRGRQKTRDRELIARIEAAEAETLSRNAKDLVIPRPPGLSTHQARRTQSEAIRAVMDQTTPAERAVFFRSEATKTKNPAVKRRLRQLVQANEAVEALRLVDGEPGSVRINPRHPELAALTDRVIRSSERQEATKGALGIIEPEQAARRKDQPGAIIRGQELAPRAAPPAIRGQGRLFDEQDFRPEGTVLASELTPGRAYGPYTAESLAPRQVLSPRVRDRLGLSRKPKPKRFTGKSLRRGQVGNVVRLTSQEELSTLRYQERLKAWQDAREVSIPGREFLRRIDSGEIDNLSEWAALRVKPGTTNLPTGQLLSLFDRYPIDNARQLVDVISDHLPQGDELAIIAREADRTGQVRFFPVNEVGLKPLEMTRPSGFRSGIRFVNQLAKMSVLFLAGPAYAIPNLFGQQGFSGIHKGIRQPMVDFWQAPRKLRKLSPETRSRIRAIGDTGLVQALRPAVGPIGKLREWNSGLARFYSRFLDDFWRENAFIYEADLRGYKTPEEITRLVNEGTKKGTKAYDDILDINHAINENFGAFNRMSEFEKSTVTDFVFFWPWIRASSVYAAKLPLNHPVKAALAELGGAYSQEQARADYMSMFRAYGVPEEEASLYADELMEMMPGTFLTEGGEFVNPLAVTLLGSPLELAQIGQPLIEGDIDEAKRHFLNQVTPALSLLGAFFGINTFSGHPYYDEPPGERLLDSVQGLNRTVTLLRRLGGDQGTMFTYTPGEAVAQAAVGSFAPRGVNVEGTVGVLERRIEESGATTPLQQERGRAGVESRRITTRARNEAGQRIRNTVTRDVDRWAALAEAQGFDEETIALGEEALTAWQEMEMALLPARRISRYEGVRDREGYPGVKPLTDSRVHYDFGFPDQPDEARYDLPAELIRDFAKEKLPEYADSVDQVYEERESNKDFYTDMRAKLGQIFYWTKTRSLMRKMEEAAAG